MYYLLNSLYSKVWDKRIVCDKQLLDSYKERGIDYRGEPEIEIYQNPSKKLELHIIGKRKDDSKYIYANEGIVENQSENVYDLIEFGDLVRYFDNIYEIKKFEIEREIVYMDTQNGLCLPSVTRFMELLNVIYKQDAKGNYIKVWEKKENE